MTPLRRLGPLARHWRYPVLTAWALIFFTAGYSGRPGGVRDWLLFEFGARTLVHYDAHYSSGALGLYAHYPVIQVGPPALALLAAVQWLPPKLTEVGFGVAMTAAGVWCVRCAELCLRRVAGGARRGQLTSMVFAAGAIALPLWSWAAGRQEHLDDVLAVTATMAAMAIIASGRRWWLAGILVGLAVASKPWAVVIGPCLLALPREQRSRAVVVALAAAGACWAPFVLGDPHTVSALGGFQPPVQPGSVLRLLGLKLGPAPGWVRPVQFVGGAVMAAAVVRRGRWLAVPLAGFAFRVVSDPQEWLYYSMGPLLGAVLWDCAGERGWPMWTALTAVAEFAVPMWLPSWAAPVRAAWFVVVAAALLRPARPAPEPVVAAPPAAAGSLVSAAA